MTLPHRTRIKLCGFTREADVDAAVQAGADAIGFVLYEPSPRFVTPERAGELARRLPPFVTPTLLFVNASPEWIVRGLQAVPNAVLQLHGDESPEDCAALRHPYLRVARIPTGAAGKGFDLLQFADRFPSAQAIMVDAHFDGFGGSGQSFDWTAFPWSHPRLNASSRLVLSGGLTPANVTDGIRLVRPWAVDVSSGIEVSKGIKSADKMQAFVAAVRAADAAPLPPR